MGFDFSGHVLRAPRVAPGNSATSGAPINGVVRDVRIPPSNRGAAQPDIVDLAGDQYRAAILDAPGTSPNEYLTWTAFSSQLAMIEKSTWWTEEGTGSIPAGSTTTSIIVQDNGGRQIGTITYVTIARGDVDYDDDGWVDLEDPTQGREGSAPYLVVQVGTLDFNAISGIVTVTDNNIYTANGSGLTSTTLATALGGGLKLSRGDIIPSPRYTLSAVKFWWTRNDRYETRFGWNGTLQRWMPYKGTGPVDLDRLLFDETYKLSPPPNNLPLGAVLPGDALIGDEYAMLRLGSSADRLSTPVGTSDPDGFTGVVVVGDIELAGTYDFSGTSYSGVVGQVSGALQFNPGFVEKHAGKTLWYVYRGFFADADGLVGDIDGELFLAPVPGPTDNPFVRINNRTPLAVTLVENEAALDSLDPVESTCAVALTTGKVKLSQTDIDKADPNSATFSKFFLGAKVIYDGVALNGIPQPTKGPRPLVRSDGSTTTLDPLGPMYLADAILWPENTPVAAYRGLGMSGVLNLPDGTGAVPDPEGVAPAGVDIPVRPGGDTLAGPPQTLGLIRRVFDGLGDIIIFSKEGAVEELVVVDRNSELPDFPFDVPGGEAYIAREATSISGNPYSKVQLSTETRTLFAGQDVYFLQATLNPSTYTETAAIYSKSRIVFRFDMDEVLYFAIDGTAYVWDASTLAVQDFYTADEVADSIDAVITGTGQARAFGDRVVIEAGDVDSGVVEIGWGPGPKDLSGATALGFLPGWQAVGGEPNWLSDSGVSMGLSRSLLNLDRSSADSDYYAQQRLEDTVFTESVPLTPFVFFDYPPVEDIAGYDDGVFFNLQSAVFDGDDFRIIDQRLGQFEEIQHLFFEGKFAWLDGASSSNQVLQRTSHIKLGNPAVVPETLLPAQDINGIFAVSEGGGSYTIQQPDVDYLFDDDGQSGNVQLITRYGASVVTGGQGEWVAGGTTFEDPGADFTALQAGYRIKVSSGSYIVQSVTDATHCEVSPAFIAASERATPWEAFSGYTDAVYDPALVADQVFDSFNHLPNEPFKVRVLAPLGIIDGVDYTAYVEDANTSGRLVSLRFGAVHAATGVTATLTPITTVAVGVLANCQLTIPRSTHGDEGAFDIKVGTTLYVQGTGLLPVASFSADPAAVEYLTAAWDDGTTVHPVGELKFNSDLLTAQESSEVVFVETLRTGANLTTGTAEYDPKTGAARISDADATTHAAKQLYFTEQMVTEGSSSDVAVSPMVGAVSFRKPLNKGCLVEMDYWLADVEGRRVGGVSDTTTEFLPLFVRRETATRLQDNVFQIDPNGEHVIDSRIDPIAYVGPKQQNFGQTDFLVDEPEHLGGVRLSFDRDLPSWATPVVTYAVFDALGGEQAYNTSQMPVYRPPFFIKGGLDNFGLRGNRVAEFEIGQMFRFGAECFYVTKLTYFADSDLTKINIFPSTVEEVGSRSPGNDVLSLVTAGPITPMVNLDGVQTPTAAPLGFMQEIPTAQFPFEPVVARQNSITFQGDLTTFAVPGHIMEVAGQPFTIVQTELSEDGTRTKLTFSSPFRSAVDPTGNPTVRLSYRPIYPPNPRSFVGVGSYVASEDVELVLFGETEDGVEQPGRTLAVGTEYGIDPETGNITLLGPLQEPLGSGQQLLLSFTRVRVMEPFLSGGTLVMPRWVARYKHNVLPTEDNGYLGATLTATYTFDNPDSFYYRALPLRNYLAEAVTQAVSEMRLGQSSSGAPLSTALGDDNWLKGNLGLLSERSDLLDKDRAARTLLTFYNDAVVAFEQVGECVTGKYIGDRDGKFRFWVGRGLEYAPPGYEDDISGELNPTNVWNMVFNENDPTRDIRFIDTDALVYPPDCTMTDLRLVGDPLGTSQLQKMMDRQKELIRNDVDDVLLLSTTQPTLVISNTPPYFYTEFFGVYDKMGSPHRYSRLFPTTAGVFFTLMPGIGANPATGDVGRYSYRTVNPLTGESESTNDTQIGQVANPVLGDIEDVSESLLRPRLPRTRIFGYYPNGLPASAFGAPVTRPCCVVSQLPLSELPIDPATGYPDVSRFLSQSPTGDLPDAEAGDPGMALPGFEAGQKIGWGTPDGKLLAAFFPELVEVSGRWSYTGIYIDTVEYGCVLTFKNQDDVAITDPYRILVGKTQSTGIPAHTYGIGRADTIYVLPPDAGNPIADPATDSPTMADMQQNALAMPIYRQGTDLKIDTAGRVLDISLPSWEDPAFWPVKEISGQNVPDPMSHIEGGVDFANTDQIPLNVPALLGEPLDDSGDIRIPYMKGTNTELARFGEITDIIGPIMGTGVAGGYYPDEILFVDGEVLAAAVSLGGGYYKEPATLMTNTRTDPAGTYGVAPAQEGDFVLVEVNPAGSLGWMGFLSVGALRSTDIGGGDYWSWIEPPRFVTQVNKGSATLYDLQNYGVHLTPGQYTPDPQVFNPAGVRLYEDLATGVHIISFQDVVFALNDGVTVGGGVGNLNTILAADPLNVVTIRLLSRPDALAVNTEVFPGGVPAAYTPAEQAAEDMLIIEIDQVNVVVTNVLGFSVGPVAHGGVLFGIFDPATGEPPPASVADERHIIFVAPPPNLFRFTPAAGAPNEWFLPHTVTPGVLKASIYGWEYRVSISTMAVGAGSTSCYIDSDRLTFHEVVDMRLARPRGLVHDLSGYALQTALLVSEITLGTTALSAANDVIPGGGSYLTFVSRTGSTTFVDPTAWNPAPTPNEEGSLRAMGFEYETDAIVATDITASVVASQALTTGDLDILSGDGTAVENRIIDIAAAAGNIPNVLKGDIVYIDRSTTGLPNSATAKAGTYIVRYAVDPTVAPAGVQDPYLPVTLTTDLGTGAGFITSRFPTIISIDHTASEMVVDDASALPVAGGHLYVAIRPGDLDDANIAVFRRALFSVDFTAITPGPGTYSTLTLGVAGSWRWADGTVIAAPATDITADLIVGKQMGWHDRTNLGDPLLVIGNTTLTVSVRGGILPDDSSVVGQNTAGAAADDALVGCHSVDFTSALGTLPLGLAADIVAGAPGGGQVGVVVGIPHANETFDPTNAVPVYDNVQVQIVVQLSTAQGDTLYNPAHAPLPNAGVSCLLPGTVVAQEFFALGGVFVEPSTPMYPPYLEPGVGPKVVDAARSMTAATVGMYDPTTPEGVHFEVRRVRRWHGAQNALNDAFTPLRFAYEIRRGIVTGFTKNPQQVGTLTASNFAMDWNATYPAAPLVPDVWNDGSTGLYGTNLGGFNSEDVNINPGDMVRILDDDGVVIGIGVVSEVTGASTLKVEAPAISDLAAATIIGSRFEVYIRQAPVPHEQSNEQLLDLITDTVIHETVADHRDVDPLNWTGGYVPEVAAAGVWLDIVNKLYDDSVDPVDFSEIGVRKDDIVIIDPMGTLPVVDEAGARPFGDVSVPTRTAAPAAPSPHVAGQVDSLDDNRGFYRVLVVAADHLEVDPIHSFAGTLGGDVLMAETVTDIAYSIFPTVSTSVLNSGGDGEGQNDLRPTRKAVGGTYKDAGDPVNDKHSMRPFSYRIIRPSSMMSDDIVDVVLMMRERMLSLIEMLRGAASGARGGFYWDWQDGDYVEDLGDPTNPNSGSGLFPNRLITTLVGEVDYSPFINTSDCLSLLDRRLWILDRRLDSLEPDPTNPYAMREATGGATYPDVDGPYTAYTDLVTGGSLVRPVQPDHLGLILDVRDRLRAIRYTWLTYRTHRYIGSLAQIQRFDNELPGRLEDRKRMLLLEQTAEDVEA